MQIFIYMEPWQSGGMPEMVFEYILKQKGLDPAADLSIDQSIDFGSTAAAFSGGTGDFTVEFEPGATSLEKEGQIMQKKSSLFLKWTASHISCHITICHKIS